MFHLQTPIASTEVRARLRAYSELLERHRQLQDIRLGPHNDMIILEEDPATGAQSALLVATGAPGQRVEFPLHRHGAGEIQVCLAGVYGEWLPDDQCVDDLLPWGETLASFAARHPGVVTLGERGPGGQLVRLAPGAGWNFVAGSQHAPCGWIGEDGLLLAQIFWPGPNQVLAGPVPVPPDAVRVWRGFRRPDRPVADFHAALGSIFIPATVQLQRLYGLTAYLPAVLPADKPAGVPDEVALVFYRSQRAYADAKACVGGRAYGLLHSTVFDVAHSPSDFPTLLDGNFRLDRPYHLFRDAVDWQGGFAQLFIGARRHDDPPERFARAIEAHCIDLQDDRPAGLDGAVVAAGDAFVVFWEHWSSRECAERSRIGALTRAAAPVLVAPLSPVAVEEALDRASAGLAVSGGECFNTQFTRVPEKPGPAA